MLKRIVFVIVFSVVIAPLAHADIQDRINTCEAKGGGACVYAILRDLAKASASEVQESKCKCSTVEWAPASNCGLGEFQYKLTRDGRVVGSSPCYKSSDSAYVECIKSSNKNLACK